jgi:bifunctional non-homologous end joining protein LigD
MAARARGEQLSFHIGEPPSDTHLPPVAPMLPLVADGPFDDPDWFFEPWWPGASVQVYIEDGSLRVHSGHMADPLRALPELGSVADQFADGGLIVEGALLVLDEEGRPDAHLLRRRLETDQAHGGQPAIVASDLLYERGVSLLSLPFAERRERLTRQLTDGPQCVASRGLRGEGLTLADAVASMGMREISARQLAAIYRPGQQDGSWLRMPVHEVEQQVPTRPLLAVLQRLPL